MSNPTERFSNRVENYVKYRPGYPSEVLEFFLNELKLQKSSVIADIGSGTGISAKIFLENGNKVFGVEPNKPMRNASEKILHDFPNFFPVSGTAENTTLSDKSVDFIIAAQAFHWFDAAKTRTEFRRILQPKGVVALIWNERQTDSTDFLRDYERFVLKFGTDYKQVRHEKVTKEVISNFFQTDFREVVFQNRQDLDFQGLKGRALSSSYIPSEDSSQFEKMTKELHLLFTQYQKDGIINIFYDTKIYFGIL